MNVDVDSVASVQSMFDELIRGHAEIEEEPAEACRGRITPTPPRRRRSEFPFWEPTRGEGRVAQLALLLAPPDIYAPLAGHSHVSPPTAWPEGHRAEAALPPAPLPSIAPVAMAVGSLGPAQPGPDSLLAGRLRLLVPITAGAFALGAVVAAGVAQLPPAAAIQGAVLRPEIPQEPAEVDPAGAAALIAELGSDLLQRGGLLAAELIQGPAVAPTQGGQPDLSSSPLGPASAAARRLASASGRVADPAIPATRVAPPAAKPLGGRAAAASLAKASGRSAAPLLVRPGELDESEALAFDKAAARAALGAAARAAAGCASPQGGTQLVPVAVTFAPSGRVTVAQVGGALAGTSAGSCIARSFRGVSVPSFSGARTTVSKTIRIK